MKATWMFALVFCPSNTLSAQTISTRSSVPFLLSAMLPSYPDKLRADDVSGDVVAKVIVRGGQVIRVLRMSGNIPLFYPTKQNIETWRFAPDLNTEIAVTFTYVIAGEKGEDPMNPQVEMLPTLDVHLLCFRHRLRIQPGFSSIKMSDNVYSVY